MIYGRLGVLVAALAFLLAIAGLATSNPVNDPELESGMFRHQNKNIARQYTVKLY